MGMEQYSPQRLPRHPRRIDGGNFLRPRWKGKHERRISVDGSLFLNVKRKGVTTNKRGGGGNKGTTVAPSAIDSAKTDPVKSKGKNKKWTPISGVRKTIFIAIHYSCMGMSARHRACWETGIIFAHRRTFARNRTGPAGSSCVERNATRRPHIRNDSPLRRSRPRGKLRATATLCAAAPAISATNSRSGCRIWFSPRRALRGTVCIPLSRMPSARWP